MTFGNRTEPNFRAQLILIIEDDEFKGKRIAQAIKDIFPEATILLERAVNSGLKTIVERRPALILLDMSLTTFDIGPDEPGGRPQNFGGMEVLRQMDRLNVVIPTIVITQHERFVSAGEEVNLLSLNRELVEEHAKVFKGLVYYNTARGGWREDLISIANEVLCNMKREQQ